MSTALAERLLTDADVAALPSDLPSGSVRYELWEGVLHIMSPTTGAHGSVESSIAALLKTHGEWQGYGKDPPSAIRRKVQTCLAAGARAVWVADPARRTLTIHRPDRSESTLGVGETFADDFPLTGLTFPVDRLFEGLD